MQGEGDGRKEEEKVKEGSERNATGNKEEGDGGDRKGEPAAYGACWIFAARVT